MRESCRDTGARSQHFRFVEYAWIDRSAGRAVRRNYWIKNIVSMQFASSQLPDLSQPPSTPRALKAINPNSVRAHSSAKRAARGKRTSAEKNRSQRRSLEESGTTFAQWGGSDENTPMKKSLAHRLREEFGDFGGAKGTASHGNNRAESPSSASSPSPRKIVETVNTALDKKENSSPTLNKKPRAQSARQSRGGALPALAVNRAPIRPKSAVGVTPIAFKGLTSFTKYSSPSDQIMSPSSTALRNGTVPGMKARPAKFSRPMSRLEKNKDSNLDDTLRRGLSKLSLESTGDFNKK